jgi:hypothetical protein
VPSALDHRLDPQHQRSPPVISADDLVWGVEHLAVIIDVG